MKWIGFDCKIDEYSKARELIEEFGGTISNTFTWKFSHTITATFPNEEQLRLFELSLELEDEIIWKKGAKKSY